MVHTKRNTISGELVNLVKTKQNEERQAFKDFSSLPT